MKHVAVIASVLAVFGQVWFAWAGRFDDDLDKLTAGLPEDAVAVVTRRAWCNHWQGEEPYDRSRAREIDRALKQHKCDALERDEPALRARYPNKPNIIKALDDAANF